MLSSQTFNVGHKSQEHIEFMTEDVLYQKALNEVQRHLGNMENITDKANIVYIKNTTQDYIGLYSFYII